MREENRIKKFFEQTTETPYFKIESAGFEYIKGRGILNELSMTMPNDLYVVEYGREVCPSDKTPVSGIRSFGELHYVFSGCGYIEYKDRKIKVQAGMLFGFPPDVDVCYYPDPSNPWAYYQVTFSGLLCQSICKEIGMDEEGFVFEYRQNKKIESAFEAFYQSAINSGIHSVVTLAKLYSLFAEIKEVQKPSRVISDKEHYVYEVFSFLKNNVSTATVDSVARNSMVSSEYLTRICESVVGLSLKECITVYRLQVTRNFLRQTRVPVAKIAEFYGCSDPKYFYKVFKKYFGVTPTQYRKAEQAVKESKLN